jgi:hypothetical protein
VRNLGVIFDENRTMGKINKMCRNVYFNIKNISKRLNNPREEDLKTLINALATPHLHYGNSLLLDISKKLEHKLQIAQNSAARLIGNLGKYDGITQHRKDLHWLPIPARIQYKILTLVWKTLNNLAPGYLANLIKLCTPEIYVTTSFLKYQTTTTKIICQTDHSPDALRKYGIPYQQK